MLFKELFCKHCLMASLRHLNPGIESSYMKLLIKRYILNKLLNLGKINRRPRWIQAAIAVALAIGATLLYKNIFTQGGLSGPILMYLGLVLFCGCFGGSLMAFYNLIAVIFCAIFWIILPADGAFNRRYNWLEYGGFIGECLLIVVMFYFIERVVSQLTHGEEKFRRIIDQSAEGFIMCDADCKITYSSPSAQSLLKCRAADLNQKKLEDLVYDEDQKDFRFKLLKLQVKGAGSMIMQQRFRTNDGQLIWTECSLNNLTHDPFVKALIVNVRNITERVDQEQQQEDFIHMASHELKNPITAIKGFLQLLKRRIKKENNTEFENLLDRIEGQTEKVLNMTAEMLNITKIKAGELQYHFEVIDLNDCLKEAVEALQATTTSHQLQLIIPAETVMVWADKTRIGQVVTNLINNAVKYSPNRDLVSVEASYDTMQVRVGVKDFGIGIPKDKQQRIFDRFYRVDTLPKGQFQGLGLGLFIASEIVRRHHGYIGVESEEGLGSTFWFTLPLRPD